MRLNQTIIILIISIFIISCSATPGDAAYRGGHPVQAANLYMQGAKLGDSDAALKLARMISESEVSISQYGSATKWLKRSCELKNNAGCHNLALVYEYGENGENKEYTKAQGYYLLAAEKGYMQSQYNLGTLYSNQYLDDNVEGLKWILLSQKFAKKCSEEPLCNWVLQDPPGHRAMLENRMTEKQILKSHKEVDEWKSK
ncbi:tetratricopeptide repeat protein [Bathymodiolus thermophilus thioautotrophic gill symbiont]|uniref:Sel1 repeat family protein n=1 Tax=Bathymodiolus thermophilus thioautotrophic gill symbiont TaxID=2360 RepID=A0A1J5ULQ6_9GAMM|nr:SEL1-like repeat protein [Bathymodiolus thermophilus thioautotrophic gill symbiont]OIR25175.1 hypothetical protein BGC33_05615 [Bathymodiolus thermophilus thioautotrophic gill symbiont]